jgi:hypothetical protein
LELDLPDTKRMTSCDRANEDSLSCLVATWEQTVLCTVSIPSGSLWEST